MQCCRTCMANPDRHDLFKQGCGCVNGATGSAQLTGSCSLDLLGCKERMLSAVG